MPKEKDLCRAVAIKEWAETCNIKYSTLESRLAKYLWSIEKALETPVD